MNQEKAQAAKPVPEDGLRPSRLDSANIFSRLTVYWVSPLISLAYKRRLEMIDVEDVPGRLHSEELGYELERKWTGNFFTTMRRVFLGDFGWIIIPFLILSASSTTTPFLVQMFLRYLSAPQGSESGLNGWAIVCLIGLVGIVQAFAINTGFLMSSVLAVRIRSAVANMVFRKAVKLSSASRASLSSGDVLNLMSQDCERIFFAVLLGHTLWWAALMMLIVAIVLLIEIGIAGVAAVLFALCLVPVTSKIAAMIGREKRKMLKYTDERVSISSEVLQGIQTVKMQNWEEFIKNKVFAMREKEMVHGKRVLQLLALNAWQVFMVPPLMAAMCFGVLAATNPDRLNVATIYAILAFLNTLLLPLDLIPRAAGTFAQALVSIKRIEMFMALKDVASIDSSSLAFGGNRERIPGGEADGSSPISSFLFNKPNARETDTKANVDADTPSNGEDVFIEQNQGEVPSAIVVDDPDRGNRAITDSSVILSMTNCTFFWTRRKDDDSYDRKKKRQTKKRLQRGVSMKQTLKTFSSSAKYARQQSLSWATSFRTGPIFKPMAEEDEVGDPEEKSHPAHHDQIVEMEEVEVLKGVTLKVARGELVVIVGEVGSGKTSLLQGVLGEIGLRPEGQLQWRVNCTGDKPSIAYVPQEPWIQNDTMKNNILFIKSRPVDEDLYRETISAVQMIPDLTTLPKGDNTEIGSRGINLSGGQKARVGLARAVYHALVQKKQADEEVVVCCDDPFSALDPNVANSVWHEVVQGLLTGFTRIVCLNSNLSLASKADRLIVLEDGVITAQGRPDDILADSKFAWLFDARDAAEHDQPASEEQAANSTSDLSSSSTTSADIEPIQAPISPRKPAETAVGPTEGVGKLYKAEERAQGTVSIKTYWNWLRSGSFKDSPSFSLGLIIFLYLFTQALKVFADLWLGTWSRSDQFSNKSLGLGIYFGVVSVMVVSSLVRALVFTSVSARASVRLHRDLITNIMRAPVNLFFDVTPVGRILNRLSSDMDHIDTKLPEVALQLLHALSMILGAIIMASYASPYILAILVPLLAIFSQLAKRLSRCQRELKRFDGMSRSPLFSHFGETLSGLTTIRSFKVAAEFRAENSRLIDTNARFFFLFWMTARWLALRVDLLAVICQFSICALALGTKTPGQNTAVIGLAVTYSLLLTTTVQACTRYVVETENSMIACERILDLISNVPQERSDGSDDFSVTEGDVEFENVSSRYRPNLDLCIKNVSFKVKGGQRVGLCGRSGSGKSTLGNILFGMMSVEPGGRLLFDGVDSATVSLKRLRSQMSVIPQTPVIFSGTIRFAIDPWSYCQSDAELWAVLQAVEMDGFVKSFPGQLDGRLDENASSLSVGERQLLCVARALLRKSKIVLLDESTASVDAHSDVVVQRAVEEGFRGATIFVIAHRLHTIVQSDLIVVMEQGRLKEFGSPSQLLQMRDGSFKKMWDLENRKQQEPT